MLILLLNFLLSRPSIYVSTCKRKREQIVAISKSYNLLRHQLGIYAGFPRRGSFSDVTHEALKCFCRIPICANTTVPIVFFQNLRLTFSTSRMVHCSLKSVVKHCAFSKESLPSYACFQPH